MCACVPACVHVSAPQFVLSNFACALAGCFSPEMEGERGDNQQLHRNSTLHSLSKSVGSAGWRSGKDERSKRKQNTKWKRMSSTVNHGKKLGRPIKYSVLYKKCSHIDVKSCFHLSLEGEIIELRTNNKTKPRFTH